MAMNILTCSALYKSYQKTLFSKKRRQALNCLDLSIARGETIGIIGPNGAGKSTLIKAIMGFLNIDSGSISINSLPPTEPASRKTIGYLPETSNLYPNISVTDHFSFASQVAGMSTTDSRSKTEEVLHLVGLEHAARKPIKYFSKGMKQRAALACALFTDPEILILDEPMSGLDPLGRQIVINIIRKSQERGTTILFCSHILNDVERICDRIGVMDHGRLVQETTPSKLETNYKNRPSHMTPLEACFQEAVSFDQRRLN